MTCVLQVIQFPLSISHARANAFAGGLGQTENIDLSKYVIDWVNENKRYQQEGLGEFYSKRMEDYTFADLTIRLGAQYLFCHQGNCEHIIVFNDVRFTHDQDTKNANAYPVNLFQTKIRRRKCRLCDIYPAKYVTYGDRLAPENPCFYCERCYRPLHFTSDGKLLYNDLDGKFVRFIRGFDVLQCSSISTKFDN
jgi:snRNA-activating protein complex subunit 3